MSEWTSCPEAENPECIASLPILNLSGTDLTGALFLGTNLERATLSECRIYGVSVWDAKLNQSIQRNLVITPDSQHTIEVDNLEVGQFMYVLLNNKKSNPSHPPRRQPSPKTQAKTGYASQPFVFHQLASAHCDPT